MTSLELYENFLLQYDVNGSASSAGFSDDEIYMFLTTAQLRLMDSIAQSDPSNELSELKVNVNDLTLGYQTPYSPYNITAGGPILNMYRFVKAYLKVARDGILGVTATSVKVKEIDETQIENLLVSEFNKPIFEWAYVFFSESKPHFVYDAYVLRVISANITYIRLPKDITETQTSELNAKYHKDIVREAVNLALRTTNDARIKTKE